MGVNLGGGGLGGKTPTTMAEINVTPMVDVMLVLLIIFMTTASVETTQARMKTERRLHREESPRLDKDLNRKVPVNLPNVNAEEVNLSEERKLVLSMSEDYKMYLGEIEVLDCKSFEKGKGKKGKKKRSTLSDPAFERCLTALNKKLEKNEKLQQDKELYLRADETLPYGRVLKTMAKVRAAGIHKFGLIAEPET
jgi:biopolymer transport protein TolR